MICVYNIYIYFFFLCSYLVFCLVNKTQNLLYNHIYENILLKVQQYHLDVENITNMQWVCSMLMDSFWLTLAKIVTIVFTNCVSNIFKIQVMTELINSNFLSLLNKSIILPSGPHSLLWLEKILGETQKTTES